MGICFIKDVSLRIMWREGWFKACLGHFRFCLNAWLEHESFKREATSLRQAPAPRLQGPSPPQPPCPPTAFYCRNRRLCFLFLMFAFWDHPPWIALFLLKNALGIPLVIHGRVQMVSEETWLKCDPLETLPLFQRPFCIFSLPTPWCSFLILLNHFIPHPPVPCSSAYRSVFLFFLDTLSFESVSFVPFWFYS